MAQPVKIDATNMWTVVGDSAANAAKNINKAAEAGKVHYITQIEVGVSAAVVGTSEVTITLKSATNLKWKTFIGAASARGTQKLVCFNPPIPMNPDEAANLDTTAGGASCILSLNMAGYTSY